MKRKLIKQGAGGYTIYLPKKWIDAKNLHEGDEVDIHEEQDSLLVSTQNQPKEKEATIPITSKDTRFIQYILNNYYRAGYDRLILQGDINEKDAHNALRLLLGFEIVHTNKHKIIIESIAKPSDYDLEQLFKRIFFILKQDLMTVKENLYSAKPLDTDTLARNSDTIIRTSNLCIRLIAQHPDAKQGFYSTLANLLTWSHRQLYYLCRHLDSKKAVPLKPNEKEFISAVTQLVPLLYDGIYTQSFAHFEKIHQHYQHYEKGSIIKNQREYAVIILYHFLLIQKYLYHATSSGIGLIT